MPVFERREAVPIPCGGGPIARLLIRPPQPTPNGRIGLSSGRPAPRPRNRISPGSRRIRVSGAILRRNLDGIQFFSAHTYHMNFRSRPNSKKRDHYGPGRLIHSTYRPRRGQHACGTTARGRMPSSRLQTAHPAALHCTAERCAPRRCAGGLCEAHGAEAEVEVWVAIAPIGCLQARARKRSVRGHARSWAGHARAVRHTFERSARRVEDTCGRRTCRAGKGAHSAHRPVNTGKGGLSTEREQGRVRSDSTPGEATGQARGWRIYARLLARAAPMSHLSMAWGVARGRPLGRALRSAERAMGE